MEAGRHVVHLYHDDAALAGAVAEWAAPALRRGGGALLVCTPSHAHAVRERLIALGLDLAAAEREGRFDVRDAQSTLSRFYRHGRVDAEAFRTVARDVIGAMEAATPHRPLRAWGEMVDLLVKEGEHAAARELETLWNVEIEARRLQLLCSYSLDWLAPEAHARVLLDVCATHTDVVPQEGPALDTAVLTALEDELGPREAQRIRALLPPDSWLLERMSTGEALLVTLRGLDPQAGERVGHRARELVRLRH